MAPSSAPLLVDHILQLQRKRDELARQLEHDLERLDRLATFASHKTSEKEVLASHVALEEHERDAAGAELRTAEEALERARSETEALVVERKHLLDMISEANAVLATSVGRARDTANAASLCQSRRRSQERRARSLSSSLRGWGDSQVELAAAKEKEQLARRRTREDMKAWLDKKTLQRSEIEARLASRESQVAYWAEKLSQSALAEREARAKTEELRALTKDRRSVQEPAHLAAEQELRYRLAELALADAELRDKLDAATKQMHKKDLRLRESSKTPWADQVPKEIKRRAEPAAEAQVSTQEIQAKEGAELAEEAAEAA